MGDLTLGILLLVLGTAAFLLEVFVPSYGLITVVGLGCMGFAIHYGFQFGNAAGTVFVILAAILVPASFIIGFRVFPKTWAGRQLTLSTRADASAGYVAQAADEQKLVGKTGVAWSILRPSGEATIEGRRYAVMTEGELVEKGAPIEVVRVEGNRVVVRQMKLEKRETA